MIPLLFNNPYLQDLFPLQHIKHSWSASLPISTRPSSSTEMVLVGMMVQLFRVMELWGSDGSELFSIIRLQIAKIATPPYNTVWRLVELSFKFHNSIDVSDYVSDDKDMSQGAGTLYLHRLSGIDIVVIKLAIDLSIIKGAIACMATNLWHCWYK